MERAGLERTIFYRHFDDLGDLLLQRRARGDRGALRGPARARRRPASPRARRVRGAIEPPVAVYRRHGPLLRAVAEAAAGDEPVAAGQAPIRRRFDELVADALREVEPETGGVVADVEETARALNLLNESYLLDCLRARAARLGRDRGPDPDRDLARPGRSAERAA